MIPRCTWLLAVALFCAGCNSKPTEKETGNKLTGVPAVKIEQKGLNIQMDKKGVTLPADFPADVSVPKGVNPVAVIAVEGGCNVNYETSHAAEEMMSQISAEMTENEWKEESRYFNEGMGSLTFTKENRSANYSFWKQGESNGVMITAMSGSK